MKTAIHVLCFGLMLVFPGCIQPSNPVPSHSIHKIDTLNEAKHYQLALLDHALTCGCSPAFDTIRWITDLQFWQDASGNDSIEFEEKFRAYANDSMRNKVKSIGFDGVSTIPARFGIFKNVENIEFFGIGRRNNSGEKLKGLEIFPNLKRIEFFGCGIQIDSNNQWMQRIENISMVKCQVNDFPSFGNWNNLKILTLYHSGFDPFPGNIHSLRCLQKIIINEYHSKRSGPWDLRPIDFRYFPCLRYAAFNGGTRGIPKRLDNKRYYRLEMRNWGLSVEDRKKIEPYAQHSDGFLQLHE